MNWHILKVIWDMMLLLMAMVWLNGWEEHPKDAHSTSITHQCLERIFVSETSPWKTLASETKIAGRITWAWARYCTPNSDTWIFESTNK
jgi:hypothetical protein